MKKILCAAILLAGIILGVLALPSCTTPREKFSDYSFDYFDTVTSVTGYASDKEEFDEIFDEIITLLGEYHRLFTIYDRYSGINNLTRVNDLHDGVHVPVKVDQKIIDMLLFAKEMYAKTDGKVNVAMGSVLSIWHEYRKDGEKDITKAKLPTTEELEEAAKHTDINDLIIDEEQSTVYLADPKMRLDVGAVAKGYAAEQIAQYLISKGVSEYVLNVGGNVRAIGAKEDNEPWTAGIENPDGDDASPYYALLSLDDLSLVTSGSYQRFYIVNGKSYHHIISPDTLMPAEGYTSVSILCESSATADALSTALFCMSVEDGKRILATFDNVEAMWVKDNGEIEYTNGFLKYVQGDNA